MNVVATSGAKVYNITAGKTLPQWLTNKSRKELKKDLDFQKRIQLLQDFDFDGACQRVRVSKDGRYIAATGTYPPRLKIYGVEDLSLKCQRRMDSEVIQFQFLSDDYKKLAFLQSDRHIEFHSQSGTYTKVRLPKFGRDMIYDQNAAELICVASGDDVYRLNLSTGQFQQPYVTTSDSGNNCLDQHPEHCLVAIGGDNGILECFDSRTIHRVGSLPVTNDFGGGSITSIAYDRSDITKLAVGTEGGMVLMYDIRSSKPLLAKDHQYDLPIINVQFHNEFCVSTDNKICKIWEKETAKPFVNIESDSAINHTTFVGDSGLLFLGGQQDKIEIYYIPRLGAAPFWCSFLDNLTEELEENTQTAIYDDYKFVTRQQINQLGLSKLVGTQYLRAYMHGYFMDARLYRKILDIANPYSYADYVEDRIKKKREDQQQSRITKTKKKAPTVNKFFHERYLQDLKSDSRFGAILDKPDFQIDPDSEEFKSIVKSNEDGQAQQENKKKSQKEKYENYEKSYPDPKTLKFVPKSKSAISKPVSERENTLKLSLAARIKLAERTATAKPKSASRNMEHTFTLAERKEIRKRKN